MAASIQQSDILRLLEMMRPRKPAGLPKIRVGGQNTGGHVLVDDLEGLRGVISMGGGGNPALEHYFASQGVQVYQYDPGVAEPAAAHPNLHFLRLGWAAKSSDETRDLAQALVDHALASSFDLLLKFDVGSTEWGSLDTCTGEHLSHFRIIVAHLNGLCLLEEPANLDLFLRRLALLTQQHTVVHLHADNGAAFRIIEGVPVPDVVTVTLLRNDRDRFVPSTDPIPGPLDVPCIPDRPDIVLRAF